MKLIYSYLRQKHFRIAAGRPLKGQSSQKVIYFIWKVCLISFPSPLVASCEVFPLLRNERATLGGFLGVLAPPKNKMANVKNHLGFLNASGLQLLVEP
jgi:hypothetical protein